METYFKDVNEISLYDWNEIYMRDLDKNIWKTRPDLIRWSIEPENIIFNAVVEDTDGLLYKLAALLPDTGPIVVKVTHWEEE